MRHWPISLAIAPWAIALIVPATSPAQSPSRDEILAFFAHANTPTLTPADVPAPATPPAPSAVADALGPMLAALEQMASKKPEPDLLIALFNHQLAHPGAEDPRSALAMGRLYWAQPKSFIATYRTLPAQSQRRLAPYLEFGWKQCIRGKLKSGRHFQQLQQDFDRLMAGMINAR